MGARDVILEQVGAGLELGPRCVLIHVDMLSYYLAAFPLNVAFGSLDLSGSGAVILVAGILRTLPRVDREAQAGEL